MIACAEPGNAERVAVALESLRRSGILRLRLQGVSMLPTLWPGDEVEIVSCPAVELRRGDIALAFREQRLFLHRVLEVSNSGEVRMRGDAMPGPDPHFSATAIAGRVVSRVRSNRAVRVATHCGSWRRTFGLLFCYSNLARNVALALRRDRTAEAKPPETQQAASLQL